MRTTKNGRNYGAFYTMLKKLPGDPEEVKELLVLSASNDRTTSLKDLTDKEYASLISLIGDAIGRINKRPPANENERQLRSKVLKLLDKLGVHVVNDKWDMVNSYLMQNRISGKLLYEHNEKELDTLIKKLYGIIHKKQSQPMSMAMGKFSMN